MNRDVNLLELGRRPWSSPTLDSGRHSRVEECEVDPESGDYGWNIHRTGAGVDRHTEDLDTDVGTLKYLTEHAQYL